MALIPRGMPLPRWAAADLRWADLLPAWAAAVLPGGGISGLLASLANSHGAPASLMMHPGPGGGPPGMGGGPPPMPSIAGGGGPPPGLPPGGPRWARLRCRLPAWEPLHPRCARRWLARRPLVRHSRRRRNLRAERAASRSSLHLFGYLRRVQWRQATSRLNLMAGEKS